MSSEFIPPASPVLSTQLSGGGASTSTDVVVVDAARLLRTRPDLHAAAIKQDGMLLRSQVSHVPSECVRWCTAFHLLTTFALMGLKPAHAARTAHTAIQLAMRAKRQAHARDREENNRENRRKEEEEEEDGTENESVSAAAAASSDVDGNGGASDLIWIPMTFGPTPVPFASCVVLLDTSFTSLVHLSLARCVKHVQASHPVLFALCREIAEERRPLVILLTGTSGTGKSTLASLLAERIRCTNIISTDSIRHTLRGEYARDQYPHLHVSTYETDQLYHEADTHSSLALTRTDSSSTDIGVDASLPTLVPPASGSSASCEESSWSLKKKVLHGYKLQSAMVLRHLTAMLRTYADAGQTVIVEGVHLLPKAVVEYMTTIPGCIPFFIFISNESKHRERFAVRSSHQTLDPAHNKYISSFANICIIQRYLVSAAEKLLVPCIDNTNVDRSVSSIHSVLLRCMRHLVAGRSLFDPSTQRALMVHEELKQSQRDAWSSKRMREVIRMKVEKKELFKRLFAHHQHHQTQPHQSQPPSDQPDNDTNNNSNHNDNKNHQHDTNQTTGIATHSTNVYTPSVTPPHIRRDHGLAAVVVPAPSSLPYSPLLSMPSAVAHEYPLDYDRSTLGGDQSRSMSVSRRDSTSLVSMSRDHAPHHEDDAFDNFQCSMPTTPLFLTHTRASLDAANSTRSAIMPDATSPAIAPSIGVSDFSPAPPSASPLDDPHQLPALTPFRLPAAASRPAPSRPVAPVDSEEDTPPASDADGDTEGGDSPPIRGDDDARRRHVSRDVVSHATPSLVSLDDRHTYVFDVDAAAEETVGDGADEEEEVDLNMDLTILQEEDEDDEEEEGDDDDDDTHADIDDEADGVPVQPIAPPTMADIRNASNAMRGPHDPSTPKLADVLQPGVRPMPSRLTRADLPLERATADPPRSHDSAISGPSFQALPLPSGSG